MASILPDFEYVSSILSYDPETGVLTWKRRPREHFKSEGIWKSWNTRFSGTEAGCIRSGGKTLYLQVRIDGHPYHAHRLAYLFYYGKWPENDVDHIDGNGLNNRSANLRDVTRQENNRNARMQTNNTTGITGVHWHKPRNKWRAQVKVNGRSKHLGLFNTIEEAAAARLAANERYGFTTRHGLEESN